MEWTAFECLLHFLCFSFRFVLGFLFYVLNTIFTLKILCFSLLHFGSSLWLNSPLWFYSSITLQIFKGLSSPHCKSRTESHMSIPRRNTKNRIFFLIFPGSGQATLSCTDSRHPPDPVRLTPRTVETRFYCFKCAVIN